MLRLLLRRCGIKGTKPTVSKPAAAGELAQGELWLNNNHESPGLFARADNDTLIEFTPHRDATTTAKGIVQLADAAAVTAGTVGRVVDARELKDGLTFTQVGPGSKARAISDKLKDVISVKDFGAVGDGVADDTAAIQAALDAAAAMFNQVAFPPAGAYYNPPIVLFPPGAYRLTNTLNVYGGLTLSGMAGIPYTVEHTRLIMDTQGGTVNQSKHILNLTRVFQGAARGSNVTVTIEDLGFWITNPGSTIRARGGTAWPYDKTRGAHIYCAESCIDARIRRCNFHSTPNAAIWFNGGASARFNIDECEFDTPAACLYVSNCPDMWPQINQTRFFSGGYGVLTENCGGQVQINGCDFQAGSKVYISGSRKLKQFDFTGNLHEGSQGVGDALHLSNAASANITGNSIGVSTESAIYLDSVDSGVISGNSIQSPGYNTVNKAPATAPAGIRLVGCKQIAVTGNTIAVDLPAIYDGFGIISTATAGRGSRSVFVGNTIAVDGDHTFKGVIHRGQSRWLNVEPTDSLVGNVLGGDRNEYRVLQTPAGVQCGMPQTYQAAAGPVHFPLGLFASCRAHFHVEQLSSPASLEFEIVIGQSSAGYVIKNVIRDGTPAVGNGPHTVTAGNTVAFSISGADLVATFAYASDPMKFAATLTGPRLA